MKRIILLLASMTFVILLLSGCGKLSDDVEQKKTKVEVGSKVKLEDLFKCSDGVSIGFKNEDNFNINKVGKYAMQASLQKDDETQDITYNIEVVDTKAPVINAEDIRIFEGEKYKNKLDMSCDDNSGEDIKAKIVSNNTNNKKAGKYIIKLEAVDSSGNKSTKEVEVTVLKVYKFKEIKKITKNLLKKKKYNKLSAEMDKQDETIIITSKDEYRTVGNVRSKMGQCANAVVMVMFNTNRKVQTAPRVDFYSYSTEGYNKSDRVYVTSSNGKVRFDNSNVDMDFEMIGIEALDKTISNNLLEDDKYTNKCLKVFKGNNVKAKIYTEAGALNYTFNSKEKKYLKQLSNFYNEFWDTIS